MKEITEDKGRIRPVVEGNFQCDENGNSTRFYEILSIVGIVDGITKLSYISKKNVPIGTPITNEEYWYPFQVIAVPKGDKGDDGKSAYDLYIEHGGTISTVEEWIESLHGADGKDAISPILRISTDGLSIEISSDNGQTWLPFQKDFNKLRVLGYVANRILLPNNANIGDIYGVWEQDMPGSDGEYKLYINTVKDWILDYTITKVYDYDTELPSSAADGTTVLVPVDNLTLDKEKVDGYKVYKFSLDDNGWTMILNTAEIYASKDDIINYGDNVYALVQGAEAGTYELYKRETGWVYFGTNASITYHLIQNINDGTSTNIASGKAVKDAIGAEATAREQAIDSLQSTIDAEQRIQNDTLDNHEERLDALEQNTITLTLTISPQKTFEKDVMTERKTLTASIGSLTPTRLDIKLGTRKLNLDDGASVEIGDALNESQTVFTAYAEYYDAKFNTSLTVQARYPIYYGFGSDAAAVAQTYKTSRVVATSAARTYARTSESTGHFFIVVPPDIPALSSFTMGGAPFVMVESTATINNIDGYRVYKSGVEYDANTTLSVVASN